MNQRQRNRTYQTTAAAAQAKVLAARQALAEELETAAEDEPMRRFPHPIAQAGSAGCSLSTGGDSAAAMAQILEQLCCQSQLLVDLLAAVNSLTAATLSQNNR